jgi:hypothetical protein
MTKVSHSSDRTPIGEHTEAHGHDGGKPPKAKHGSGSTSVHGGMTRQVNGQPITGGGHDASALDSLSGATVPLTRGVASPGWGNSTVRNGSQTVHPPASKQLKPVGIHPSMSKGAAHDQMLADLGASILSEAARSK